MEREQGSVTERDQDQKQHRFMRQESKQVDSAARWPELMIDGNELLRKGEPQFPHLHRGAFVVPTSEVRPMTAGPPSKPG